MPSATGAQIVGRIAIRVLPDLTGFREELNAQLRSQNPTVRVDVVPEIGRFLTEVSAAVRAASAQKVKIRVDADEHWIDRLGNQLNGIKGVDLSSFNRLEKALLAGSINAARLKSNVEQVGRVLGGRPEAEMSDGMQRAARFARANYLFVKKTGEAFKKWNNATGRGDAFAVRPGAGDNTDIIRQIKGFEKLQFASRRFGQEMGKAFRTLDDQAYGFRRTINRIGDSDFFGKIVNGFDKGLDGFDKGLGKVQGGIDKVRKAWDKIPDTPIDFWAKFDKAAAKAVRRAQGWIIGASDRTRILNDRTEQFTKILKDVNGDTDVLGNLIRRGTSDVDRLGRSFQNAGRQALGFTRPLEKIRGFISRTDREVARVADGFAKTSKEVERYRRGVSQAGTGVERISKGVDKIARGWTRVNQSIGNAGSKALARISKDIDRHGAEVDRVPRYWRRARKQIQNAFSDGLTDILLEPLDEFGRVWGQRSRQFGDSTVIIRKGVKELTDSTAILRDGTRVLNGGAFGDTREIQTVTQSLRRLSGDTEQFTQVIKKTETETERWARQLRNLKDAVNKLAPGLGDRIVNYGKSVKVADEHTGRLNRTTRTAANVVGSLGSKFTSVGKVMNKVVRGTFRTVTRSVGLLGKGLGLLAKPITAPIAAFNKLGHTGKIVVAILSLLPGIIGLIGGLIAGLPSLLFAVGAGFAAVALGMDGIKAAAKTLEPEFEAMKKSISQNWQDGLTPIFQQLKPLFPVVTDGLNDVTDGMLDWAAAWADTLEEAQSMGMIEDILGGIGKFFSDITPFMDTSLRGILNWTKAGVQNFGLLSDVLNRFGDEWVQMTYRTVENGSFNRAMSGLADAFGVFFSEWIQWLEYGVDVMGRLGPEITNFISGFSSVMFGMMPILEGIFAIISGALAGIGTVLIAVFEPLAEPIFQFARLVETIFINLGIAVANTIGPLAQLIAPIFSGILAVVTPVIQAILDAFNQMAATVGPALEGIISQIGPMIDQLVSAVMPLITEMANTLGPVIAIIGNAIGQMFQALGPSIAALVPILGQLTSQIANFINNLLVTLAPVLQRIGEAFVRITAAIAPVIPAVGGFLSRAFDILAAAVIRAVDAIIPVVDALLPVLENIANQVVQVFSSIGNSDLGILDAITSVIVGFIELGSSIATFLIPALNVIGPALAFAASALSTMSPVIAAVAAGWVAFKIAMIAANAIMTIWRVGVMIFNGIMVAVRIGILAWTAAQWLLNVALNANPISLIVLAIAALVAGIIWVATQTTFFQDIWNWAWTGIQDIFNTVVDGIKGALEWFANLNNHWKEWLAKCIVEIGIKIAEIVQWFKDLPGKILNALGDLADLLFPGGREILEGFLRGLKEIWKPVQEFIEGITKWIFDNKGPLPYDRKLLVPAGNAIMGGLQKGLQDGFEDVMTDVLAMGTMIESGLSVEPTVEFSGADGFKADAAWRQELAHTVVDPDFGNEPIEVTSVITLDGKTVAKSVNKTNRRTERRG